MKKLMSGNEAIARGAWEAGSIFGSGYPGTPSTEILENFNTYEGVYAEWAPNEKIGLESAIGASIAGARSFATMKHVGLNVAADPLFTCAYTGVNAGLLVIDADDPGMGSSQNEQDNRWYAKASMIPMVEPANSQECLDYVKVAFEISEQFDVPVLFRVTTRVCHSKSLVELREKVEFYKEYEPSWKFDAVPGKARKLRIHIEDRTAALVEYACKSPLNRWEKAKDNKIGVITSGIAYEHTREVFGDDANILKLGMTYPFPAQLVKDFAASVDTLYIVEELDPFIETHVRGLGIECIGKDKIPSYYELNPDIIRESLLGVKNEVIDISDEELANRPPTFCAGCPHRGFFAMLKKLAKKHNAVAISDIGCYAMSGMPPLSIKDVALSMGAGFSIAHGMQRVFNATGQKRRAIAAIGDSTFFHSGLNGLLNCIYNHDDAVFVILDNRTTAMTGHQDNPGTGFTLQGRPTHITDIEEVCRALGCKHIRTVNPIDLKDTEDGLNWAFEQTEPVVLITRWPCALKKFSDADVEEFDLKNGHINEVHHDVCIGCRACIRTGCPALFFNDELKKSNINPTLCIGCDVCAQVCPVKAIQPVGKK